MQERIRHLSTGLALVATALVAGCSWQYLRPESRAISDAHHRESTTSSNQTKVDAVTEPVTVATRKTRDAEPVAPAQVWDELAADLTFKAQGLGQVRREMNWYRGQTRLLYESSQRAAPFLHHVMQEIRERDMPADLALLPILESGYEPTVVSPHGAAGLWQFMGGTGRKFGLHRTAWMDERLDVVASTEAALDYLDTLATRFDGDWLLAIAAYNAGWGNVERAIARNRRAGRKLDVWSLPLSRETHRLLARMVALSEIYRQPTQFALSLPDVPSTPYFASLTLERPTDLRQLVFKAGINEAEFRRLNPGLKGWHTGPNGGQSVLVPVARLEAAAGIAANLPASVPPVQAPADRGPTRVAALNSDGQSYTVRSGDSLWLIARRFNTRVATLAKLNNLSPEAGLSLGQRLLVKPGAAARPKPTLAESHVRDIRPAPPAPPTINPAVVKYQVREGDSLWTISLKFKVTIEQLLAWNKLTPDPVLQPGQELVLYKSS
ncbi:MAG: LysM peptidoglycan-binding domain-containing protein [Gammaproteobacteria bacterium]|nr:LysM peptidoglycan-binding domain-containing protein [Gammaproteobacteria bacterium]